MNCKTGFSYICCFISVVISLLILMVTTCEINEVKQENIALRKTVDYQQKTINNCEKDLNGCKIYVDDVVRNIVDKEW